MDDHWAALGEQFARYASVAKDVHGVLLPLLLKDCKFTLHVQALVKLEFRDPSRTLWDAEIDRLRAYLDRPAPGVFVEVGRFPGIALPHACSASALIGPGPCSME